MVTLIFQEADEFVLKHMEARPEEFPVSDVSSLSGSWASGLDRLQIYSILIFPKERFQPSLARIKFDSSPPPSEITKFNYRFLESA
jgi:hypothetical protein